MQTGKINVQTENIFPIIKKFLYSDHEIFLRELISNAVDATKKLQVLANSGELKGEIGDIRIQVEIDKKKGTLTVKDRGIGMTQDEVDKYINQIAFSSAEEFINKYKDKAEGLIGHFGLGFYSSFMVSDKVEILTRSYKSSEFGVQSSELKAKGSEFKVQSSESKETGEEGKEKKGGKGFNAVKWECDGSPDYKITDAKKKERGTDVILYISKENEEFLEDYRVEQLLRKYCKFLPVEIQFGMQKVFEKVEGEKDKDGKDKEIEIEKPKIINNTNPLWTQQPAKLTDEDYKKFYRELYPMNFDEPLFNIHLNVDYPFNLTGILYFPRIKKNLEMQKDKIQLYSNQVFVTDSVEGIVPDFLTLLHGVLDSPDIPLNVSRSYLQSDPNVKKISTHISKKVADKLEELFKKDRTDFEKKWDDIKVFIEYGMVADEKFYERAYKFCLLKNTDNSYFTLDDYRDKIKVLQTDKDKKVVYLYANNADEQHSYIQIAKERGYDVLLMDGVLDLHFVNTLEGKLKDVKFIRVDADTIEKLIEKEGEMPSKLSEEERNKLKLILEKDLEKDKFIVLLENLSEKDQPMIITQPEFFRRMKDMAAIGGGMPFYGNMPETYNLIVNTNHPLIVRILNEADENKQQNLIKQMVDLALLSQNLLKGEKLTEFVKRSVNQLSS
jgi:molecular chaperone HtpG